MKLLKKNILSSFDEEQLNSRAKSYLKKIKISPHNPWAYSNAGDYFLDNSDLEQAYSFYQEALSLNPNCHVFYYKLGVISQKLKDYPQSHFYYATAILLKPDNYWYYDKLCQSLIKNNQLSQAIVYLQEALKLKQNLPSIYRKLGFLYLQQDNLSESISNYKKLIKVDTNHLNYLHLANVLSKGNRNKEAISFYQKFLEFSPYSYEAYQGLGDAFSKQEDFEQGIANYQKAKYFRQKKSNSKIAKILERTYVVNHKYRFVYCPIYKVGCSSLKRLMLQINEPKKFNQIVEKFTKGQLHNYVDNAYSLFRQTDQEIEDIIYGNQYFKFVFVRNPWTRLISAYLNKFVASPKERCVTHVVEAVHSKSGLTTQNHHKSITFKQFIDYLVSTKDDLLDGHWKPQYLFLGDIKFDFIGKLESMTEDFQYIRQKINLEFDLAWVNKTKKAVEAQADYDYSNCYPSELRKMAVIPSYQSFYTSELIELVKNRYRTDIEMFNYKFE